MPLRVRLPQPRSQAARWCRPGAGAHQHLLNSLPGTHLSSMPWEWLAVVAVLHAVWRQGSGGRRQAAGAGAACGTHHSVVCFCCICCFRCMDCM